MLAVSKWLLILSGFTLIFDEILVVTGTPNPLFGWPLPCPISVFMLGAGIILFGFGSQAFNKKE